MKRSKKQPRTVNKEVHAAWLRLRTFGDVKNIQELLKAEGERTGIKIPFSQPTVTLAINKGCIFKPQMEAVITKYFNDKLRLTEGQKELVQNVKANI